MDIEQLPKPEGVPAIVLRCATTTITEQAYAELLDDTTRRELLRALQHTTMSNR